MGYSLFTSAHGVSMFLTYDSSCFNTREIYIWFFFIFTQSKYADNLSKPAVKRKNEHLIKWPTTASFLRKKWCVYFLLILTALFVDRKQICIPFNISVAIWYMWFYCIMYFKKRWIRLKGFVHFRWQNITNVL